MYQPYRQIPQPLRDLGVPIRVLVAVEGLLFIVAILPASSCVEESGTCDIKYAQAVCAATPSADAGSKQ